MRLTRRILRLTPTLLIAREMYAWGVTWEKRPHVRRLKRRVYDATDGLEQLAAKRRLSRARRRRPIAASDRTTTPT